MVSAKPGVCLEAVRGFERNVERRIQSTEGRHEERDRDVRPTEKTDLARVEDRGILLPGQPHVHRVVLMGEDAQMDGRGATESVYAADHSVRSRSVRLHDDGFRCPVDEQTLDHAEKRQVDGLDLLVASPAPSLPVAGRRLPQRGRDFGDSLRLAFEDAFALGYRRVLVVGNDAPEITSDYLRRALDALDPVLLAPPAYETGGRPSGFGNRGGGRRGNRGGGRGGRGGTGNRRRGGGGGQGTGQGTNRRGGGGGD